MNPQLSSLVEAASRPYIAAGKYPLHFARGKLRHDPVFFALLEHGLLPEQGRLLDLGCGQGVLMALINAAKKQFLAGHWPPGWPAPPARLVMHGIELRADRVRAAREALGDSATVELRDICDAEFPPCTTAVVFDVLLYLNEATQREVLARIAAALQPGGLLLLREADADAGLSFQVTQWSERVAGVARGRLWQRLHYRSRGQWVSLLEALGFAVVRTEPMSQGTPFANILFVARRAAECCSGAALGAVRDRIDEGVVHGATVA